MDNAALNDDLWKDGGDCFGKAREIVNAGNQDIFQPSGFQVS